MFRKFIHYFMFLASRIEIEEEETIVQGSPDMSQFNAVIPGRGPVRIIEEETIEEEVDPWEFNVDVLDTSEFGGDMDHIPEGERDFRWMD